MAKLHSLIANFARDPVQIRAYVRAARGRKALHSSILVSPDAVRDMLKDPKVCDTLNVKVSRK